MDHASAFFGGFFPTALFSFLAREKDLGLFGYSRRALLFSGLCKTPADSSSPVRS
jgi:hypothetical protein